MLLIVSGASGVGKSTLCKRLLQKYPELSLSISLTSRQPRGGERNGREYHFVSAEEFRERIGAGDFAEHALVHGNYYGTSLSVTESAIREGRHLLFDIDWQGTKSLTEKYPQAASVMILPPDFQTLADRLTSRATDSAEVIERRLAAARHEISNYKYFRYLIVNDDLDRAAEELEVIYRAELLRRERTWRSAESVVES